MMIRLVRSTELHNAEVAIIIMMGKYGVAFKLDNLDCATPESTLDLLTDIITYFWSNYYSDGLHRGFIAFYEDKLKLGETVTYG